MFNHRIPVMEEATSLTLSPAVLLNHLLLSAKNPSRPGGWHVAAVEWQTSERQAAIRASLKTTHVGRGHKARRRWVKSRRRLHVAGSWPRGTDHAIWWTRRKGARWEVRGEHSGSRATTRVHHAHTGWRRYHGPLGLHLWSSSHLELRNMMMIQARWRWPLENLCWLWRAIIVVKWVVSFIEKLRHALWTHLALGRTAVSLVVHLTIRDIRQVYLLSWLRHADQELLGA